MPGDVIHHHTRAPAMALVVLGAAGATVDFTDAGAMAFAERLAADPANAAALGDARLRLGASGTDEVIVRFARGRGEAPAFAYLVGGEAARRLIAGQGLASRPGAAALVFPVEAGTGRLWVALRDAFGVTAAEARLAARLKDGLSLKDVAAELGVTLNTARNQLKSIFDKMGLRRQSELVRTLGQLGALDRMADAA